MTNQERVDDMVKRYGEVCRRSHAAKILHCTSQKINAMLADGRLEWACAGTMVDVRSIAQYICQPKQAEFEARINRIKRRTGSRFAV